MRTCGNCTMCCKILGVDDEKLKKPANKWCQHCAIGLGCGVYEDRPKPCQEFECLWLQNETIPEDLRPDKTHVVLYVSKDEVSVIANVDPERPEAYKKGQIGKLLAGLSHRKKVFVVIGDQRKMMAPDLSHFPRILQK